MIRKVLLGLLILIGCFLVLVYVSVGSSESDTGSVMVPGEKTVEALDLSGMDSIHVAATNRYEANTLKEITQGKHYREAWATYITVPVVYLDSIHNGLKITDEGGGNQTHSLELQSPQGINYTLRSINKDPEPLIPEIARRLGLKNIVIDGISAQHPYGAIVTAELAEAAGLLHTQPVIVFVPKQPSLGQYNERFGNQLFFLEYETENKVNWTLYKNVVEIVDTKTLILLKKKLASTLHVEERLLVRARLFDMIIGDWDRHSKQWGWVLQDRKGIYTAIPLAADRDNAFFKIEGIIPSIISHPEVKEEVRSFEKGIDHLPGLVQPFDRYFLLKVSPEVFLEEARVLQQTLTDEMIEMAVRAWPEPIFKLNGNEVILKLKHRRDKIGIYAERFKILIDEEGPIDEPLSCCEHINLEGGLQNCFECISE